MERVFRTEWNLNLLNISLYMQYRRYISSIFSTNSEAFASELVENLEEMYRYNHENHSATNS